MNETKFDWDDLRLFLAVARDGGLASASANTGKSPATLGRRMLALERRLGQDLFHRQARGYDLTQEGAVLLEKTLALESLVYPIVDVSPERAMPIVKISAGTWVTHLLCQHIAELVGQDQVRLRFIASNDVLDIGRREALIGVRNQRPEGIGLAGRRIARVEFAVFATDPKCTTWARVLSKTPSAKWVQEQTGVAQSIEVTSPQNALDLALAGAAKAVLPVFIGSRFAELRQVSNPIADLAHDQWLVTHHEDRFVPDVRKVIDRIYAVLTAPITAFTDGGGAKLRAK